jgi:Zn finger protein HypA/HybF involved in hydrogenase expression
MRQDFDYTVECGYWVCDECGPWYPMEVEEAALCPECGEGMVFVEHSNGI